MMKIIQLNNPFTSWLIRVTTMATFCFGIILLSTAPVSNGKTQIDAEKLIFDFAGQDLADYWLVVNDGVMGGVSESQLVFTPNGTALFRGNVSLDNNGGFASVRTYPADLQLDSYEGLILRLKGDGQKYKLRLRTGNYMDRIAYQATFQTQPNQWLELKIPFDQTVPVYRGYVIRDAPPLDSASITQIGFMISDKQTGAFELEIDSIKAYRQIVRTPSPNQAWGGAIPW
jgi:NADH dehydrogenase [ubiquinone] 1 alpha subcomplex assembly factor 1